MQSSEIPAKFSIPFGNAAGTGFIRDIPTASQIPTNPGFASLTDGFPPLNATPRASGGIPPFIQDMNGILRQLTRWSRWLSAGGPIRYDAAFSTAIGGYPRGATLMDSTSTYWLVSTIDNNTNPTSHASWRKVDLNDYLSATDFQNQFPSGSNANGYWCKRPNGAGGAIIEQWGRATAAGNGYTTITFPIPFTVAASISANFDAAHQTVNAQDNNPAVVGNMFTVAQMMVYSAVDSALPGSWRAIGL